jgi:hypothetical protein
MRALASAAASFVVMLAPGVAFAAGSARSGGGQQKSGSAGVHVDPGSPSGHEYVIPISGARGETSGGAGSPPVGGTGNPPGGGPGNPPGATAASPPLFGVGVTPSSSSSAARGSSSGGRRSGAGSRLSHNSARPHGRDLVGAASLSHGLTPASAGTGGPSAWLILLGGAALVLLVGGGGGFAIRRTILRT